jgi:hypothetical protein
MKLSHQILVASALSLASVVAPRFVDARYVGASKSSVKRDAVKTVEAPGEARHGINTERTKW